jgi:hypothetical protein
MQDAMTAPLPMMTPAPLCELCNRRTLPARIMPRDEGEEIHIFECPVCAQSQSLIVQSK